MQEAGEKIHKKFILFTFIFYFFMIKYISNITIKYEAFNFMPKEETTILGNILKNLAGVL